LGVPWAVEVVLKSLSTPETDFRVALAASSHTWHRRAPGRLGRGPGHRRPCRRCWPQAPPCPRAAKAAQQTRGAAEARTTPCATSHPAVS